MEDDDITTFVQRKKQQFRVELRKKSLQKLLNIKRRCKTIEKESEKENFEMMINQ
jgi:hypothetical protein